HSTDEAWPAPMGRALDLIEQRVTEQALIGVKYRDDRELGSFAWKVAEALPAWAARLGREREASHDRLVLRSWRGTYDRTYTMDDPPPTSPGDAEAHSLGMVLPIMADRTTD